MMITTERYVLFGGPSVYAPSGGMEDFIGAYESREEALIVTAIVQTSGYDRPLEYQDETKYPRKVDWWHLVDWGTKQIIQTWVERG
jgi:hypothetical protein